MFQCRKIIIIAFIVLSHGMQFSTGPLVQMMTYMTQKYHLAVAINRKWDFRETKYEIVYNFLIEGTWGCSLVWNIYMVCVYGDITLFDSMQPLLESIYQNCFDTIMALIKSSTLT